MDLGIVKFDYSGYKYKQNCARAPRSSTTYVVLHSVHCSIFEKGVHISPERIFAEYGFAPHFFIKRDGTILRFVDEEHIAYHAGESCFGSLRSLNNHSLGIEIESNGPIEELRSPTYHIRHRVEYTEDTDAFTQTQYSKLVELLKYIYAKYTSIKGLLAHSDIAADRKNDPGYLFNWRLLAEDGFGSYYHVSTDKPQIGVLESCTREDLREMFRRIGYTDDTVDIDYYIKSFKIRYCQHNPPYTVWTPQDDIILSRVLDDTCAYL